MANFLYDTAREKFLRGLISWELDSIKLVLVDNTYVPKQATDTSLENILATSRIATSPEFTLKGWAKGIASAADVDVTIPQNKLGIAPHAFVIYKDSFQEEFKKDLIAYIDTAAGLQVPTTTTVMKIAWNTGSNKIFKL